MWGRKHQDQAPAEDAHPRKLRDAVREARIESAERTAVVVDLRDAERARLELLNEALDPLFAELPPDVDLFDRGISQGDTPRLWIDAISHVVMGRDKRLYRFVLDGRYGRSVIAESFDVEDIVTAITRYVARRLVERERALAADSAVLLAQGLRDGDDLRRRRRRAVRAFFLGLVVGAVVLLAAAWFLGPILGS